MRPAEEDQTRSLLTMVWHAVDSEVAEEAGAWVEVLPSHHTIDSADLAIAATAISCGSRLPDGQPSVKIY